MNISRCLSVGIILIAALNTTQAQFNASSTGFGRGQSLTGSGAGAGAGGAAGAGLGANAAAQQGLGIGTVGQSLNAFGLATLSSVLNNNNGGGGGIGGNRGGQAGFGRGGFGGGGFGRNQLNRQNQQGGNAGRQAVFRTRLTPAFQVPAAPINVVRQQVQDQLRASTQMPIQPLSATGRVDTSLRLRVQGQPLTISLEGQPDRFGTRLAVIRGTVASSEDRLVAEKLAMMSPGVGRVRNEVQVAGSGQPLPRP